MSLPTTIATFLADVALGSWLGAMTFFSFVAAPTVFDVLDRDRAGRVVNAVFPTYYVVGVGLGLVAAAAVAVLAVSNALSGPLGVVLAADGLAVATAAYARWILIPKMEAAGDDAFDRYHRRSVILNGVAMLAVVVALAARHLAA